MWDTNKAGGSDLYEAMTQDNQKFRKEKENASGDNPDEIDQSEV